MCVKLRALLAQDCGGSFLRHGMAQLFAHSSAATEDQSSGLLILLSCSSCLQQHTAVGTVADRLLPSHPPVHCVLGACAPLLAACLSLHRVGAVCWLALAAWVSPHTASWAAGPCMRQKKKRCVRLCYSVLRWHTQARPEPHCTLRHSPPVVLLLHQAKALASNGAKPLAARVHLHSAVVPARTLHVRPACEGLHHVMQAARGCLHGGSWCC